MNAAEEPNEIEVSADDAAIGRAFRWSLALLALIGVIVVAVWLGQRDDKATDDPGRTGGTKGPSRQVHSSVEASAQFVDVTSTSGVDFVHYNGAKGEKLLPETMGGGCAFFDYDRDGDADLLFVNGTSWDGSRKESARLYQNDGSGSYVDVTHVAGLDTVVVYGMGVATGDFDGDGWIDLYLTAVGTNRLLRNVDGSRFEDVTTAYSAAGAPDAWSSSAAFFDMDGDGDLDLFVCQYIEWSPEIDSRVGYTLTGLGRAYGPPTNFAGSHCSLFRNDGERFTEVSAEAGIHVLSETGQPMAKALAVRTLDHDSDGDLDVFVANDTVRNFFFENLGGGKFAEVGRDLALAHDSNGQSTGAMGVDFAWYRNDDTMGIAVGNFANEMTSFYVATADELIFADDAMVEGVGATSRQMLTFGLFFFDYDLDRRLDYLQVNGHLEADINQVQSSQHYRQSAQLYWNAGNDSPACFTPVENPGDLAKPIVGRGASYADIDGDGDLDVVMTQINGPPLLLRNDRTTNHHWIRVRLEQPGRNVHAIGAVVTVVAGGERMVRGVVPSRSYLSAVERTATFGLGSATQIESAEVRWPDGVSQSIALDGVDRLHVVRRQ